MRRIQVREIEKSIAERAPDDIEKPILKNTIFPKTAKVDRNRHTIRLPRLLLVLLAFALFSLAFALHPANVASAQAKVKADGTLTTHIRFDLAAFVTGAPPKEADDRAMNAFLDGSDDAMRAALADAEARFRAEFRFGGTVDRLIFPTVADVRAFLAGDPKPRLPAMLTAIVEGHLPPGARTIAFQYPSALGTIIQTVEFPYEEPVSEPVEPGYASATLTVPSPEQVAKLAAAIAAPRRTPSLAPATPEAPKRSERSAARPQLPSEGEGPGVRSAAKGRPASATRPSVPVVREDAALTPSKPTEPAPSPLGEDRVGVAPNGTKPTLSVSPPVEPEPATNVPEAPAASESPNPSPPTGAQVATYLRMGYAHILPEGLDHILFVLGLFLLGSNTKSLLKQITAFTVAHSITLALATLDLVRLPGRIIEPLIAFSIAFVAIENLYAKEVRRWRTAVVFLFGLVHGMGFAEVFKDAGLSGRSLLAALLSFNVGVELGQLSVVALALLAVGWFRQDARYRRIVVVPCSLLIALVALFWTAQRILA